jgi:hypothetical protein
LRHEMETFVVDGYCFLDIQRLCYERIYASAIFQSGCAYAIRDRDIFNGNSVCNLIPIFKLSCRQS